MAVGIMREQARIISDMRERYGWDEKMVLEMIQAYGHSLRELARHSVSSGYKGGR